MQWLMEKNAIGRFIHSNCSLVEHTLIDDDSITKFRNRGMGIGAYTLFPLATDDKHEDYHSSEVKRLMKLKIDWITTDHPDKVHEIVYDNINKQST